MAEHHCRVLQTRPNEGEITLATGVQRDGDDAIHLTLHFPIEREVDMPRSTLEQHVNDIEANTAFDTRIVWDD